MPTMSDYERWLGFVQITPVLVPHDCSDGFLYAYWRRPAAYLDTYARSGSSSFYAISNAEAGSQKLRRDLETAEWERRYADLLTLDKYDTGLLSPIDSQTTGFGPKAGVTPQCAHACFGP